MFHRSLNFFSGNRLRSSEKYKLYRANHLTHVFMDSQYSYSSGLFALKQSSFDTVLINDNCMPSLFFLPAITLQVSDLRRLSILRICISYTRSNHLVFALHHNSAKFHIGINRPCRQFYNISRLMQIKNVDVRGVDKIFKSFATILLCSTLYLYGTDKEIYAKQKVNNFRLRLLWERSSKTSF